MPKTRKVTLAIATILPYSCAHHSSSQQNGSCLCELRGSLFESRYDAMEEECQMIDIDMFRKNLARLS